MGFKFFTNNEPFVAYPNPNRAREAYMRLIEGRIRDTQVLPPDQPETVEDTYDRFHELINHQLNNELRLTTDNRPAVFLQSNRGRDTFSDEEWSYLIKEQRRRLIEHMWEQGLIIQTIVSQDEYGFTLRSEINF